MRCAQDHGNERPPAKVMFIRSYMYDVHVRRTCTSYMYDVHVRRCVYTVVQYDVQYVVLYDGQYDVHLVM